jgi:type I restriction enzyme S subunit
MRFSDFVTLQRGFDLPKTEMQDGPYPVLGSTSIIGFHSDFKVEPPGVVTGRSGSLGVVQFVAERYWPHNTSLWVKDFKGNDAKFVYYCMKGLDFARFNAGSGVPTLNRNHLDSIEVEVPSFPIQRRIAGILSAYDELIENSQRRIKILEAMARAIYREWFVHFRFPGHESVPRIPSPFGDIPQGWRCVRLADIGELTVGGDWGKDEPDGADWVQVGCLRGVDLHAFAKSGFSDVPTRWIKRVSLDKRRVTPADVLVEGSGECGRSLAGSAHLENLVGLPVVYSNFCKRVRFGDAAVARFCEHMLNEMVMSGEMNQFRTGTTIPNLNMTALFESHSFVLPPPSLLRSFVDLLELSDAVKLSGRIQNLRLTRDLLLPRLLSGQIDVEALAS